MKFINAKSILVRELADWQASTQASHLAFTRLLSSNKVAQLIGEISLDYESKRNKVYLLASAFIRCPGVSTHALTPHVKAELATMPEPVRHSVTSLRRRLDGRIYQVTREDFFANERPLPPSTEISGWEMLDLIAFLSEVKRSFSTLERRPLPANEIPKLLKWVKQRAIARADTLTPISMKSWTVIH